MHIRENIEFLQKQIPDHVLLCAVSKTNPVSSILEAYHTGQRIFGENKVQELTLKYEELPKDIEWHMIGHMQSNKVKYIAPFISVIHGVDNIKLLQVINKEGARCNRVIRCLLQVHIANEETKFGFSLNEIHELINRDQLTLLNHIKVCGVMGMASYTIDENQIRNEFRTLKSVFDELQQSLFFDNEDFKTISMGMSGDYLIAIEEGSTMIRLGSAIFGERTY